MVPKQVHAEMKATREIVDHRLDMLQARIARSKGRFGRVALAGSVLVSALF